MRFCLCYPSESLITWGLEMAGLGKAQPVVLPADGVLRLPMATTENKLGSKHSSTRQMGPLFRRNESRHREDPLPQTPQEAAESKST